MNVDDIVRIKIEEAARKIAAARRQRETRQEARRRGLAQRHAQKLRNLAASAEVTPDQPRDEECAPRAGARDDGHSFQAASDDMPEVA